MKWIARWLVGYRERRSASHLHGRIKSLEVEIGRQHERLEQRQAVFDQASQEMQVEIKSSQRALTKAMEEVDHLRSRNQILEDTMVPMLVAVNNKILARLDAEAAIQTRRQVAANVEQE